MTSADPGIEPGERPTSEDAGHVNLYTNRPTRILAASGQGCRRVLQ